MKKWFMGLAGALFLSVAAFASQIPYLSTAVTNEPSQENATLNGLINTINTGVTGLLGSQVTPVATTLTTIQPLWTYSLPGGQLAATGQTFHVHAWGVNSADANVKTVTFSFGGTTTAMIVTGNAATWVLDYYVVKSGASTQIMEAQGYEGTTLIAVNTTTGSVVDTAAITFIVQGTAATAGTVTLTGVYAEQLK